MVRPKVCCLVVFLFEVLAYTSMIGCLGQAGRRGMEGMEGIGEAGQVSRFLGRVQVDKNQVWKKQQVADLLFFGSAPTCLVF